MQSNQYTYVLDPVMFLLQCTQKLALLQNNWGAVRNGRPETGSLYLRPVYLYRQSVCATTGRPLEATDLQYSSIASPQS
jgi:hypothetical protein